MDRRGFLGSILAACAAPAIVRADSLMRIIPTETKVLGVDGVSLRFNSSDLALSIDEFSRKYIEPAVARLMSRMEADILAGLPTLKGLALQSHSMRDSRAGHG